MPPRTVRIALFRNDLRVADNPMLQAASRGADELLPLYCFDPRQVDLTPLNSRAETMQVGPFEPARTWHAKFPRNQNAKAKFLVESVLDLQKSLRGLRSDLVIRFGAPDIIVSKFLKHLREEAADANVELFCQREQTYEETKVEAALRRHVKVVLTDGGSTLVHPDDAPFEEKSCPRVFTTFRKQVEALRPMVRDLAPKPDALPPLPRCARSFLSTHNDTALLGAIANMHAQSEERAAVQFRGGASAAAERLAHYCAGPLFTYKKTRNALTGPDGSSHLSPFLAVGALSAREVFWAVRAAEERQPRGGNEDSYWLIFELLWRDYWKFLARGPMGEGKLFSLYGIESTPSKSHRQEIGNNSEWKYDLESLNKWKDGQTGIPFIDANMRELTATGYMSNRGRQNVANFLAGQLHIDWRLGAEWFESCLIDHDPCSNYGNWTYVAGVGTDPRAGRNFNILKQANDYDADAPYVRLWIPELANVPQQHAHHPWTFKDQNLGDYPKEPIMHRPEWDKFLKVNSNGRETRGREKGGRGRRATHRQETAKGHDLQ